jgi:hydrogenase maturation protease
VLGLGNTLNRDEGLGVHALKALEARLRPSPLTSLSREAEEGMGVGVEFLDGGTLGLHLLPLVEEASHLLILDAVNTGQPPGTLVELRKEQIPLFTGIKMSEHQVTFQEVLGLARFRGRLPQHLRLIGAQPADLNIGTELSPTLAAVIPKIVERAEAMLREWGLLD